MKFSGHKGTEENQKSKIKKQNYIAKFKNGHWLWRNGGGARV